MIRRFPIANGEVYHLFNRSIARQPIFTKLRDFQRFLDVLDFYRYKRPPLRYSHYQRLAQQQKAELLKRLYETGEQIVEIYAFALMPNHFHLLVKQLQEKGIKQFVSCVQNSFAKYYNTKYNRSGSLFQEMFKAVRIETDEQFIHVARYIHLNPLTNYIIKDYHELELYPWTSFYDYVGAEKLPFLTRKFLMSFFSDKKKLKQFTLDQSNYQRTLEAMKHLYTE